MTTSPVPRWSEVWEEMEKSSRVFPAHYVDFNIEQFRDAYESAVAERKEAFLEILRTFREATMKADQDSTEDEEFLPEFGPEEEIDCKPSAEEVSYETQEETPDLVSDESSD